MAGIPSRAEDRTPTCDKGPRSPRKRSARDGGPSTALGGSVGSSVVELTESYKKVLPRSLLQRYAFAETRNAAAVLQASNPAEFDDVVAVLSAFRLVSTDITEPGRNKSPVAARLDLAFRERGWREGRYEVHITSKLVRQPWPGAGERKRSETITEAVSEGYKVDNLKARVALDGEWNAKDGNLSRDLASYRVFYEHAIIDCAVMVTRTQDEMRELAVRMGAETKFGTTTTTNLEKLLPMMQRGDAGGCPLLAVAITPLCL